MDPNNPFFYNQFFQPNNSQPHPQFNSQAFTQGGPQYGFQFQPQQYPFNSQSQFPSHQPSQSSQPPTTQNQNSAPTSHEKNRNPNWSKKEDEVLCQAWLNISEDAVTGVDQPRQRLWDRIRVEFHQLLGRQTQRDTVGLMNRWGILQNKINKFSACVQRVERTPRSGGNDIDNDEAAKHLYVDNEGRQFQFYGCWLILKNSPKWFHYTAEQQARKEKLNQRKRAGANVNANEMGDSSNPSTPASIPSSVGDSVNLDDEDSPFSGEQNDLPRPPGRKVAKTGRRKKNVDNAEALNDFANAIISLQNNQKELAEKEIEMAAEREKMKIQSREAQKKLQYEKEIMMSDPESMPTEAGKIWLITQQNEILARLTQGRNRDGSSGSGV